VILGGGRKLASAVLSSSEKFMKTKYGEINSIIELHKLVKSL